MSNNIHDGKMIQIESDKNTNNIKSIFTLQPNAISYGAKGKRSIFGGKSEKWLEMYGSKDMIQSQLTLDLTDLSLGTHQQDFQKIKRKILNLGPLLLSSYSIPYHFDQFFDP